MPISVLVNSPPAELPAELRDTVRREFPGSACAEKAFFRFLVPNNRDPGFAEELIETARGSLGGTWEFRCAAVLMLEKILLGPAEYGCRAEHLAAKISEHNSPPAVRLKRRLRRLSRVHRGLQGVHTTPEALRAFIHVSRQPCKLTLGKYLFNPLEIAGRIEASVRLSSGAPQRSTADEWEGQALRYRNELSENDNCIVDVLTRHGTIYWVDEKTPSTINAMCEYPLGTVALVLKPPGSDVEFEIKRAGVRGDHALSVVFERNGTPVPWSHRLHGGSGAAMLDAEFRASAAFAEIYEAIHAQPAPMSRGLATTAVQTVPTLAGEEHVLTYFTQETAFGEGFDSMRQALARCVDAFEAGEPMAELRGSVGLTVRFLRHLAPRQALLAGTSSFRLQLLERYLSPTGADLYFRSGLNREYTGSEARLFADDLLEEILGVVEPAAEHASFGEYLDAAFAVRANRIRADKAYLSLIGAAATYWGTLLGVGGFSYGESFVDRNVGIRSRWTPGGWRPRICFMDHDSLIIRTDGELQLERMIDGIRMDQWYVCGEDPTLRNPVGQILALNRIYRADPEIQDRGAQLFRKSLASAYRAAKRALATNPVVQHQFPASFLRELSDWDRLVRSRLRSLAENEPWSSWSAREQFKLIRKGYSETRAGEFTKAAEYGHDFFQRFSFVFAPSQQRLSRSKAQASG